MHSRSFQLMIVHHYLGKYKQEMVFTRGRTGCVCVCVCICVYILQSWFKVCLVMSLEAWIVCLPNGA